MTDFTISTLATTLAEGSIYSFSITPKTALAAAIKVRWEIVADGKIPISADDFASFTGVVDFAASATAAQTIRITATDDSALEADQNFQIRIYQVVGDDDSTTAQTDDILLGAQAVRLDDNDAPTDTGAESFGVSAGASNAEGNVNTAANTQDFALNAKGGNDTYIITRYQSGDVKIAESAGIDLIKFDFGVFIDRFGEVSTSNFTRLKIEATILTLSTGAKIEIEFPDRSTSFQLGDGEIITSYAAFKTAIGASGTNATATFIAESYEVTAFTTTPDVSANTIEVAAEVLESTGLSDVIGLGGVADVRANGAGGDDTFVITRFQSGDVAIDDTVGTNLIKFDYGVSIKGFAEVSRISFGQNTISLATLTLANDAEIEISFPAGAFNFQLGDATVIETYAAFKTAIGASGTNAASALLAAKTISHPTENFPTSGAVVITHVELSLPTDMANIGEVLTADTSGITDADDATLTFTYQWKLAGSDTVIGTAATYTPTAAGAYTVKVTATDSVTNVNTAFTSAAEEVVVLNTLPTGAVTVSATDVPDVLPVNIHGLVFTATAGGLANAATQIRFLHATTTNIRFDSGTNELNIDFTNGINLAFATLLAFLQEHEAVKANFDVTTGEGYDATANTLVLDAASSGATYYNLVATSGGTTYTANTSTIADANGRTGSDSAFSYQWLRGGADISGAESSTYTQVAADAGKIITVRVSYTDDGGRAESVTSVVADEPTTGAVRITHIESIAPTNEANVGEILAAVTTRLTDPNDAELDFTYQWKLAGSDISGATGKTYKTLTAGSYTVTVAAIDDVSDVNTPFTSTAFDIL